MQAKVLIEAVIYDLVTRALDLVFKGIWPVVVFVAIGAIVWFALSRRRPNTSTARVWTHSRLGLWLEPEKPPLQKWDRWIALVVAVAILGIAGALSAERLSFPSLARKLTPFQQDFIVVMYIPRRWDKSTPAVAAALGMRAVAMIKKYGEPRGENAALYAQARDIFIDHGLLVNDPDQTRFDLSKKGIRFGAYLESKDPIFKESKTYRKNKT